MKVIELKNDERLTESMLSRKGSLPPEVVSAAAAIVEKVRTEGDEALRYYERTFDHVELEGFRVPAETIQASLDEVGEEFLASCRKAAAQIRDFHQREVQQSWFMARPDGTILGQKVTPLDSVGIYVPGGRAQYPSTVLMNAIPAKVAGVGRIVMVTPPQAEGGLSPYTLCAAAIAGVDEIYTVGGAQAIAALAYGTESIPQVSKIHGAGQRLRRRCQAHRVGRLRHRHGGRPLRGLRPCRRDRRAAPGGRRPHGPGRARPHGNLVPGDGGPGPSCGGAGGHRRASAREPPCSDHPRLARRQRDGGRMRRPRPGNRRGQRHCPRAP